MSQTREELSEIYKAASDNYDWIMKYFQSGFKMTEFMEDLLLVSAREQCIIMKKCKEAAIERWAIDLPLPQTDEA